VSFAAITLLCCFSASVYYCCVFRYRISLETFGYDLVLSVREKVGHKILEINPTFWCMRYLVLKLRTDLNGQNTWKRRMTEIAKHDLR